MKIKKFLLALVVVFSSLTCSHHQSSTTFLNNKFILASARTQCNPEGDFPQMVLIPYFVNASQIMPNCDIYPVHKTALVLFIFYHQWLEYFEDDDLAVKDMLEEVMIRWGYEKRTIGSGYDLKGEPFTNHKIIGLVEGDTIIWVWRGSGNRMSESALIHELVHLAIRAQQGEHGDPDHEGDKYPGWTKAHSELIYKTKQMLRAFGL